MLRRSALLVLLPLVAAPLCGACDGDPPTGPGSDPELHVLFIGNSLTGWHDLPALVRTIGEADGHPLRTTAVVVGGFSLEDHWNAGVAAVIRQTEADVVVLQQGPSSLPENRVHLRTWSETLSAEVEAAGGRPALLMIWPSRDRLDAFDAVRASYAGAAEAVDGLLIPAGEAWRLAWERRPELELYGPDGFHPGPLGSVLAAAVAYGALLGRPVDDLPARLVPTSPALPTIELEEGVARVLFDAAEGALRGERPSS